MPPTPALLDPQQAPIFTAAYLLICTDGYARLYPVDGVRCGDRSTVRKVAEHTPVGFAATFSCDNAPGLVVLSSTGVLKVRRTGDGR